MKTVAIDHATHWRTVCRKLLRAGVKPHQVRLVEASSQPDLFGESERWMQDLHPGEPSVSLVVPKSFLQLVENVGCHRDPQRWNLLYRMLWRLTHGEPFLLDLVTDEDVLRANQMNKIVTRDAHKAKAFVRFRRVEQSGVEHFIAWYQPDHRILRKVAPFFSRRFQTMNWTILTPDESVTWDQNELTYHAGVPRSQAPDSDELEELWKTYYASIFNPARVKIKMMKSEMPVRFWKTLPETEIIDELVANASDRVQTMIDRSEGYQRTASDLIEQIPVENRSLDSLRTLAESCQVCDLHREATQTVFGSGNPEAPIVIVGEQPGDAEDLAGKPFVGPAGQLLRQALAEAGIPGSLVYLTNVVKHFKHKTSQTPKGKKRLHQRPNSREIRCCKPWLQAELEMIDPQVLVLLGVTAAQAVFDRGFKLTEERGRVLESNFCQSTMVSWHPSAVLRMPDPDRADKMRAQLVADLAMAFSVLAGKLQTKRRGGAS